MMNKITKYALAASVASIAVFGALYGGFLYGKNTVSRTAYTNGYKAGSTAVDTTNLVPKALLTWREGQVSDLTTQNKQLVDDYNALVNKANSELRQASVQASYKPLSCTSTAYGINSQFTRTNCY